MPYPLIQTTAADSQARLRPAPMRARFGLRPRLSAASGGFLYRLVVVSLRARQAVNQYPI